MSYTYIILTQNRSKGSLYGSIFITGTIARRIPRFSVEDSENNLSNCDTSMKFGRYVDQTVENTNHLLDIENIQHGGLNSRWRPEIN